MIVVIVPGSGGVGSSVFACALALSAASAGWRSTLVDCDELGGGLDVVLAAEAAAGLRWPELRGAVGELDGQALRDALPRVGGLSLLAHTREPGLQPLPPEPCARALIALDAASHVVVVDASRQQTALRDVCLAVADEVVLVVGGAVRSIAASQSLLHTIPRPSRMVVSRSRSSVVSTSIICDAVQLPCDAEWQLEASVSESLDRGDPGCLLRASKRGVVAAAQVLVTALGAAAGSAAA